MNEQDEIKNHIIVVLGDGRSGTSLLTRILLSLGMTGSSVNISASEQNPVGCFEDASIVKYHLQILTNLNSYANLPLVKDCLKPENTSHYIKQLVAIVSQHVKNAETIWGFKDPKTSGLLPLWMRVFNISRLIPSYVLSVRNPASVVESKHRQYNDPVGLAELVWLYRTCESLYHTGGNCFIVHYEDWLSDRAADIGQELLRYTGLDRYWNYEESIEQAVRAVIKPNLNRAVYNDYQVKNRYVLKLYDALQQCRGDQFDHKALMDVVMDCRRAMEEFSGWSNIAQHFFARAKTNKNNELLIKCKDLQDDNEQLRIRLAVHQRELHPLRLAKKTLEQEVAKHERKIFLLETSTSFQIGQHFINAFARPGKNTILLPFYLARTLLASRAIKK